MSCSTYTLLKLPQESRDPNSSRRARCAAPTDHKSTYGCYQGHSTCGIAPSAHLLRYTCSCPGNTATTLKILEIPVHQRLALHTEVIVASTRAKRTRAPARHTMSRQHQVWEPLWRTSCMQLSAVRQHAWHYLTSSLHAIQDFTSNTMLPR
jgi:hypothetical protein